MTDCKRLLSNDEISVEISKRYGYSHELVNRYVNNKRGIKCLDIKMDKQGIDNTIDFFAKSYLKHNREEENIYQLYLIMKNIT